ncbi:MAG: TIGR01458 family HAD-type hydrolase, partial [Solirubrobacterales bacterium]
MKDVRGLLLDLDGVLYVGDEPVEGAQAAVVELRDADLGLRFVTNTTERSKAQTLEKLENLGFELSPQELVTPAALARKHCLDAGHRTVALIMNEDVKRDFEGLEEVDERPDAVIMGDLGEAFGFEILNRAFRMVMDGAELVALQKNRFWLTPEGLSLDAGPFVAAIEYATGREAVVVGKPSRSFFE